MHTIYLALCVASIAFTVTWTGIFKPLRDWVDGALPAKLGELIHCPYCFSHYVTLLLLLVLGPSQFLQVHDLQLVNFLVSFFAIETLVALMHYVMLRAYEPVSKAEMMRKLDRDRQAAAA